MIITFIIGNGFDLQMGLKTRYSDFYKVYKRLKVKRKNVNPEIISKFKNDILRKGDYPWNDWSDFERNMGIYSAEFEGETSEMDFIVCVDDFVIEFNRYLRNECNRVDWSIASDDEIMIDSFATSLHSFFRNVKSTPQGKIGNLSAKEWTFNFVQFNYTDVFDRLINADGLAEALESSGRVVNITNNLHVHGKMGVGGYMTMGVNDKSQIMNELLAENSKVQDIFVKNKYIGVLQKRDVNRQVDMTKAMRAIDDSDVICVFGSSIGDTDKIWWERIGNRLKKRTDGVLLICGITGINEMDGVSPKYAVDKINKEKERQLEIREDFAKKAKLDPYWVRNNPHRLLIEIDTDMFNFSLPMKPKKQQAKTQNSFRKTSGGVVVGRGAT